MLREITIRRIALIDELTIEWRGGFQVITGETGAGKSIVVGALAFLLGEPTGRDMLQTGAARGGVQAVFDVSGLNAVRAALAERDLEIDDNLLTLSREMFANGRTVCRAAGEPLPLAAFRRITAMLVDLHGQHAHQVLLDPKSHLAFLDAFGDAPHKASLDRLRHLCRAWREAKRDLDRLLTDAQERARRLDMLRFQLDELTDAKLSPDEEKTLEEERTRARHAEKIHGAMMKADTLLSGGERSSGSIAPLKQAIALLGGIASYDPRAASLAERLESLGYELDDAAGELSRLADDDTIDPKRIDRVESRLDLLHRLMRKYGASTREMIEYRARVSSELEETLDTDARAERFRDELGKRERDYLELASKVSAARRALSQSFSERMTAELAQLGMERARFEVGFEPDANAGYREDGVDRAQFCISANAGEPLKPLSGVASGGELSRIMLAIKSIAADHSGVPVVIFDEIDTGISGRMAQAVAEKMAAIARHCQVICVTHLPQIAAMSDGAYRVAKVTDTVDGEERTRSTLERLDETERVAELARMLGGADPESEKSRRYAKTMINDAAALKRQGNAVVNQSAKAG
ncbi:MAG: DNA repair protein RecN [Oscillospiraceae bacterium]|jgi:DNA repair protein RecN (Recombination protein N)|nr:DNA repair protein RecN [Oscillospiraceae bacterium]